MNRILLLSTLIFVFCGNVFAQSDLQQMYGAERSFDQIAEESGMKAAFLGFLASDAIVFRPNPVNGIDFWKSQNDAAAPTILVRNSTYADISFNGLLGYTMGSWRSYPKGKRDDLSKFGQFVTLWEKNQDGKFRAAVDVGITHDEIPMTDKATGYLTDIRKDPNISGRSPADASMNFLTMSMNQSALGGAYDKFAADDVRVLHDGVPPIVGKKTVVSEMKRYKSINFPKKVALFQAADMAYTWNACEFADSNEGIEKGNCLHIWKLRDKKWWIVLGVFARVTDDSLPSLKPKPKAKK